MHFFVERCFVFLFVLVDIWCAPSHALLCVPEGDCRQLPLGESCETLDKKVNYNTNAVVWEFPDCQRSCSCSSSSRMQCDSNSDVPKPVILDISFQGVTYEYVTTITWEQPTPLTSTSITGYTVLISKSPTSTCKDIKAAAPGCAEQCSFLQSGNSRQFSFKYNYVRSSFPDTAYVQLIPHVHPSSCTESSVANFNYSLPRSCHYIHPGDCNTCGSHDYPPTPKHVTLTGTWKNHGFYLFISWELAAVYNSPYPDETYYITISYEPNGMLAAPVLEVVGRRNITVTDLDRCSTYAVKVQFYDCGCSNFNTPIAIFECVPPKPSTLVAPQPSGPSLRASGSPSSSKHTESRTGGSVSKSSSIESSYLVTKELSWFQSHSSSSYAHLQSVEISPTVLPSSPGTVHQVTEKSNPTTMTPKHSQPSDAHRIQAVTIAVLVVVTLLLVLAAAVITMCLCRGRSTVDDQNIPPHDCNPDLFQREKNVSPILCTGQGNSSDEAVSDITSLYEEDGPSFTQSSLQWVAEINSMRTNDPERKTVFVVYSDVSSDLDHRLAVLTLELIQYLSVTMEILESPIKGSYPTWVNETVKKCSLVLCVCNQQFQEDWDMGREGSIVSLVKHLYDGSMMRHKQAMSKYAVVLLHEEDSQFIPCFLQGRKCFMFIESNVTATVEEIVCYVTDTPRLRFE